MSDNKIKVFLDDIRPTPEGWVRCYWPSEVIKLLIEGNVEELSLDHDLGETGVGARTGKDVLAWVFERVVNDNFEPPIMKVHSDNGPEIMMMRKTIDAIYRWKGENM